MKHKRPPGVSWIGVLLHNHRIVGFSGPFQHQVQARQSVAQCIPNAPGFAGGIFPVEFEPVITSRLPEVLPGPAEAAVTAKQPNGPNGQEHVGPPQQSSEPPSG